MENLSYEFSFSGSDLIPTDISKIILASAKTLKVKQTDGVILYDFTGVRPNIVYKSNKITVSDVRWSYYNKFQVVMKSNEYMLEIITDPITTFPHYVYLAEGETATDEPADRTIIFPPQETHAEWIERIAPRLLHLTRRVSVLRHEEPHLSSRSRRVCLDLDDRNEYVHRYDHSINLMRLPVGKLQLDINAYNQRWDAHEKKVAEAEAAGTEPPEFTRLSDRDTIEALLEKLEERLTEDMLLDHHETHNSNEWRNAHADRKVVLCNADCSVGEVLLDINSFHTDRHGNTNHQLAEQSFHDVAVKHWNEAKRTRHREIVRERVVVIPD